MSCSSSDLDVIEAIKENDMNSSYENMDVAEGIIQGTEVGEQANESETDWENIESQFSFTDLYCVYSDGKISHVNEGDELISDVELYCVIEADEPQPSQTDTYIEKYYEFSDGEVHSQSDEEWEDSSNESHYCVIDSEQSFLNISESEWLSPDVHQLDIDLNESLQSDQCNKSNVDASGSESDFVLTAENDSVGDNEKPLDDSLSCVNDTGETNVSNVTESQISESDLASCDTDQIHKDESSLTDASINNVESRALMIGELEGDMQDAQPIENTKEQNGEGLDYPSNIIVPHIININQGSQDESDNPVLDTDNKFTSGVAAIKNMMRNYLIELMLDLDLV